MFFMLRPLTYDMIQAYILRISQNVHCLIPLAHILVRGINISRNEYDHTDLIYLSFVL